MSTVIRNNLSALKTYNTMNANQSRAQKHLTRVATGEKLNSAQDDSAAYSISERMRGRIRSLEQAHRNTQNGSSMLRTAEGAVADILELVKTLKEKAINSANDSNTDEDRRTLQKEFNQLVDQIDDSALVTFNGKYLIDNSKNNALVTTRTILYNGKLDHNTIYRTAFSEMKARSGENLGITEEDIVSWSYVTDGKTFHGSVKGKDKMEDLRNQIMVTEGGAYDLSGVTNLAYEYYTYSTEWWPNKFGGEVHSGYGSSIINQKADVKTQIAGFTINVTDARGNVNLFANRMLAYDEINRAENKTGDLALSFQVGTKANVATKFALTDMRTVALGLKGSNDRIISISTQKDANAAIYVLDNVLNKVVDQQTFNRCRARSNGIHRNELDHVDRKRSSFRINLARRGHDTRIH